VKIPEHRHRAIKARVRVTNAAANILGALVGPNWRNDENFQGTANRVSRMYVDEVCFGLFEPKPSFATFGRPNGMDQMITVGPCVVHSLCPHHLAPIVGKAWVGVVPGSLVPGLSKYARLVRWCAARPIMQESLTEMIAHELQTFLPDSRGIAVVIKAEHMCMSWRGVREPGALTTTSAMRGLFLSNAGTRAEFMQFIK
jgi:GTP cyclohydrolase I